MLKIILYPLLAYVLSLTDASASDNNTFIEINHKRYKKQTIQCTLPPQPSHGNWKLVLGNGAPGDKVPESTVIKYDCNYGYKFSRQSPYVVCDNQWNSMDVPECEKLCPPQYSSNTYQVKCVDKKGNEVKCNEATELTYLQYSCIPFYETPFGYKKTLFCENGKWNQARPMCQPVCGKKLIDDAKPLIAGVKPNDKLEYPWVTAVYRKINGSFANICGGSILSQTLVLTAAHCVTNDFGDVLSAEDHLVGVGKLYNKYQEPRDIHARYLQLSNIIVHDAYKAENRRFLGDIAVLVVKEQFQLNEVVQPICFNNLKSIRLLASSIGEVSGWGFTDNGEASDVLRTLKIPYKYETTCALELPAQFANRYNLEDKICAGFVNRSTSVCDGDSGSGLAFKNPEDNRYYIHGLVSLGPKIDEDRCDIQQNTLYTKVATYYEFVDRLLNKYAPEIKDCQLPSHPENGKWISETTDSKPGDFVPSSRILKIQCDPGFKLSSSRNVIECRSAYIMPSCKKLCPALNFTKVTNYACTNEKDQPIDCSDSIDGSKVSYSCPSGSPPFGDSSFSSVCTKGSWQPSQLECRRLPRNCGKTSSEILATTEQTAEDMNYPWYVGIYDLVHSSILICSGGLISHKIVVTAAHCVTNSSGHPQPTDNYRIAAGKEYAALDDLRDQRGQISEIERIITHRHYRGAKKRYLADIALLIAKTPFKFNQLVYPICFYDVKNIQLHTGDIGIVTGWKYRYGEASDGLYSKDKVALRIRYKDYETCEKELPEEFANDYQGNDKICGDSNKNNNSELCVGDSGKTFAVRNPEDGRYYVHGVVTLGPRDNIIENRCHHNTLYTSITFYYDFIEDVLPMYQ